MCNERPVMVVGNSVESSERAARGVTEAYFGKPPSVVASSIYDAVGHCRKGIFGVAYVEASGAAEFRNLLESQRVRRPDQIVEYTIAERRLQNDQSC